MSYFFSGNERWQGWWETPNQAAAFLVCFLPVMMALVLGLIGWRKGKQGRWLMLTLGLLIALIPLWLLARTYSRGGWFGMAVSLIVLAVTCRKMRPAAYGLALLFGLCLVLLPSGVSRVRSAAKWEADASVSHRFWIWKGALQMLADHPLTGVGAGQFGEVFMAWYQPGEMTTSHLTAVNDFLTVGAERGAAALVLLLSLIGSLLWAIGRQAHRGQSMMLAALTASITGHLSCCVLSSLLFNPMASGLCWILCAFAASYLFWCLRPAKARQNRLPVPLFTGAAGGLILALSIWGGGFFLTSVLSTRSWSLADGAGWVSQPRKTPPTTTVLYFGDAGAQPMWHAKSLLRPLAESGVRVVAWPQPEFSTDALAAAQSQVREVLRRWPETKLILAGNRQGGQVAMGLGALTPPPPHLLSVAVYGTPFNGPFAETSAAACAKSLTVPLWIAFTESDSSVPSVHARRLAALVLSDERENHLIPLSGESSEEFGGWCRFLAKLAFRVGGGKERHAANSDQNTD